MAALLGLVAGTIGLWLLLLLGTHVHAVTKGNVNWLVSPAWALLLVVPGARLSLGREKSAQRLAWVARSCVAAALLQALLLPIVHQDGFRMTLLFVPIWVGLWLGAAAISERASSAA